MLMREEREQGFGICAVKAAAAYFKRSLIEAFAVKAVKMRTEKKPKKQQG